MIRPIFGIAVSLLLAVTHCGPQEEQGPPGPAGDAGAQGPQGPAGTPSTVVDAGLTIEGPVNIGPVALDSSVMSAATTISANALGSGVNGPDTAQLGLQINMTKDNWWTGGKVGEVDGLGILLRQNAPDSDSSGILVNVQNQGNGFLSATEFVSSIVDPQSNTLTRAIDVQEGVLDALTGDYIGAVFTADTGALATGILIQTGTGASWAYGIRFDNQGNEVFSVDGTGKVVSSALLAGSVSLNGDPLNGSVDIGNQTNSSATPYMDLNGFGNSSNVRLINDANGQLTVSTVTGGNLVVNAAGAYASGGFHVTLSTPASSSSPCTVGQLGADVNYFYVCTSPNKWKRSALSNF